MPCAYFFDAAWEDYTQCAERCEFTSLEAAAFKAGWNACGHAVEQVMENERKRSKVKHG